MTNTEKEKLASQFADKLTVAFNEAFEIAMAGFRKSLDETGNPSDMKIEGSMSISLDYD